jgi:hypothetical protein
VAYTRFTAPGAGRRIGVTLSRQAWTGPDVPSTTTVVVDRLGANGAVTGAPVATRSAVVHRLERVTLTLPAPNRPFRLSVHFQPTFSPSQFGLGDTRQLGAQVSFALTAAQ